MPRLANFHGGELLRGFLRGLEDAGYAVWSHVVDCAAYGVPQTRQRLVVLASRVGPQGDGDDRAWAIAETSSR